MCGMHWNGNSSSLTGQSSLLKKQPAHNSVFVVSHPVASMDLITRFRWHSSGTVSRKRSSLQTLICVFPRTMASLSCCGTYLWFSDFRPPKWGVVLWTLFKGGLTMTLLVLYLFLTQTLSGLYPEYECFQKERKNAHLCVINRSPVFKTTSSTCVHCTDILLRMQFLAFLRL